jgi:hypothetical protein
MDQHRETAIRAELPAQLTVLNFYKDAVQPIASSSEEILREMSPTKELLYLL